VPEKEPEDHADLNRVALRPLVALDFADSAAFVDQLGKSVTAKGMFIAMRLNDRIGRGQEIEIRFTLDGRKEILSGTAKVVFVRDGSNGETPGYGVAFRTLTDRSRKNLEMIQAWREEG